MAASSFENVAAITGFGVVLGMIFAEGTSPAFTIALGPLEVLAGLLGGALLGATLAVDFPANRNGNDEVSSLIECESIDKQFQAIVALIAKRILTVKTLSDFQV